MPIFVTNDDGYTEGLQILFDAARRLDRRAYAIIPDRQRSAVSVALTLHKALRLREHTNGIWKLNGTPADAVLFALNAKKFPRPTLVLSGINSGDNCAISGLLSSGTVGACWQAMLAGIPSIAFSIYKKPEKWDDRNPWKDRNGIEIYITDLIKKLRKKAGRELFYNVTLPDDLSHSKVVFTKRLQRNRFRAVITERLDPNNIPYYWLSGDFKRVERGTDIYEVAVKKNITITPVRLAFGEE